MKDPLAEYHMTRRQLETAVMFYLRDIHGVPWKGVVNVRMVALDDQEDVAVAVELAPGIKLPGGGSTGMRTRSGFKEGAGI